MGGRFDIDKSASVIRHTMQNLSILKGTAEILIKQIHCI